MNPYCNVFVHSVSNNISIEDDILTTLALDFAMSLTKSGTEGLALCGVFVVLTMLYYLTTSKAPDPIRKFSDSVVTGGGLLSFFFCQAFSSMLV